MIQWQTVFGRLILKITCADSAQLLNTLTEYKLRLENVTYCSELELHATVYQKDYMRLLNIAEKQGAKVKIVEKYGIYHTGKAILKRPVLVCFAALLLILSVFLSGRVLFVSVEGNTTIPDKYIIETAAQCGIRFGAVRRHVRSEVMKNALLERIPELQWAGINTSGCTAVISVREKTIYQMQNAEEKQICSIVAARDGIIQTCTVYRGNPLCAVGQAVKAGQTLVSGYQDCGIIIKGTHAKAEIKALTFRELDAVAPAPIAVRGEIVRKKTYYSLRIGKNLIKFYKDSGNLNATCDKIYSEEYMHLPGGFQLPIAIITQTHIFYEPAAQTPAASGWEDWLGEFAKNHLRGDMIAGEIISAETDIIPAQDACHFYGKYTCMEMIGQVKYEQILLKDEIND